MLPCLGPRGEVRRRGLKVERMQRHLLVRRRWCIQYHTRWQQSGLLLENSSLAGCCLRPATCSAQQTGWTTVSGQLPKQAPCGSDPGSGICSCRLGVFSLGNTLFGWFWRAPTLSLTTPVCLSPPPLHHDVSVSGGDRRRLLCSLTVIKRSRSH